MRHVLLKALTCCAFAGFATGQSTQPKKAAAPPNKTAPAAPTRSVPKTSVAKTGARTPVKPAARPVAYARSRYAYRRPMAPPQPTGPSPDRCREIQDALASRGYLKTSSSGVWDKDSMDAMQRFQQDQNLDATGKLTARSLGALGLGPKTAESALPQSDPPTRLNADRSPLQ